MCKALFIFPPRVSEILTPFDFIKRSKYWKNFCSLFSDAGINQMNNVCLRCMLLHISLSYTKPLRCCIIHLFLIGLKILLR